MKSQLVKLGKLCKIQSGGTPRRGIDGFYGGNIPWAKIGDIENAENGYLFKTVETVTELGLRSINNKIFPKNTVFLAMYGSVGKTAIAGLEMTSNQAILGLQPNNPNILCFSYLKYWLDYSKDTLLKKARGVALQNISATIVKDFDILLPSIEDQKRIVQILDAADALRQKRKKVIKLLDDYLKSVFLEMFGDLSKNEKKWKLFEFENYVDLLTDYHANGSYEILRENVRLFSEPNYALMVRTTDLENDNYTNDVNYIDEHAYNFLSKSKVFGGEIIINKIGSAGKIYLMPKLNRPVSLGMNAFLLRFKDGVNVNFIYYLLTSAYGKAIIQKKVKGAVTKTIRKDAVKSLLVPDISPDLQNKFSVIFEKTESIKQKMLIQSQELETSFQALMQKAFKGEL